MNQLLHTFPARDAAQTASLAHRILAGDLSGLPDHWSAGEWRREAQAVIDCECDDSPLEWMIEHATRAPLSSFDGLLPDMSAKHPLFGEAA